MAQFLIFAGCGASFRSPFLFFGRILAVFSMLARFHGRAWGRAGRVRRYVGVIRSIGLRRSRVDRDLSIAPSDFARRRDSFILLR